MIAVLDIGKTNKKTIIFNSSLEIVAQKKALFSEYEIEDGIRLEQPEQIFDWFLECLREFSAEYTIEAISITTQGASLVCLDKNRHIALPPVAYTTGAGTEFDNEFYGKFGSKEVLQRETSTAPVGSLINCAKLIYFLQKKYSNEFQNVKEILLYPQYFVERLTDISVAEPTYLGCHTYLYNGSKKTYSRVAQELGIDRLLPRKIVSPWTIVGRVTPQICSRTGLSEKCIVTAGIHDSNSSLLPYIITNKKDDFILNSTGTWCVLMHQSDNTAITDDELGKTIFYNFDAFNNPVKTAVFMGGKEYEVYSKIIEDAHSRSGMPKFSPELYQSVLADTDFFFIPSVEVGVGILPDSKPGIYKSGKFYPLAELKDPETARAVFSDYERSFAALNCSLAAQSKIAIDYTNSNNETQIFIEGGFRNNSAYCQLLAELFPQCRVYTTSLEEATSIGAAVLAIAALNNDTPYAASQHINITRKRFHPIGMTALDSYTAEFIRLSSAAAETDN